MVIIPTVIFRFKHGKSVVNTKNHMSRSVRRARIISADIPAAFIILRKCTYYRDVIPMWENETLLQKNYPFTAPIMIPLVKYLWKNGYTSMIGITTNIVTVIRIDVALAA